MILRGDGEYALQDLLNEVASQRRGRTLVEQGPRGDSQSHGRAERTVRAVEEMTRVLKADFEKVTSSEVDTNGHLFGWMIRHAVDLLNKRNPGGDGATPWQRLRGRAYRGQLLRFGVPVLHRLAGEAKGGVLMNRWAPGHWVGKTSTSD